MVMQLNDIMLSNTIYLCVYLFVHVSRFVPALIWENTNIPVHHSAFPTLILYETMLFAIK